MKILSFKQINNPLYLTLYFSCFLLSTIFSSYAEENEIKIYNKSMKHDSDVYRITVVSSKLKQNAIMIAEKLYNTTNQPVYIHFGDNKYNIQIGGFSDINRAEKVMEILQKKGIKNLSIIKGKNFEYIEKAQNNYSRSVINRVIYTAKINSPIKIDGDLNEAGWMECIPAGDFITLGIYRYIVIKKQNPPNNKSGGLLYKI